MLPASGLFAEIVCPFRRRGLCERPHCLYKHEAEVRDMFAAPLKPSVGPRADLQAIPTYPPTESSECLQELARINKEIENVKNEVEKERWKLSCYQTEQVDGGNAASATPQRAHSQTACTHAKGDGYKPSSHRRTQKLSSQAQKYVVDNSKPRTDLEYDPLSNFSADLRSYSSSGRDQKAKAAVKRARDASCSDRHRLRLAGREARPVLVDDLLEEGDLVIDIPSSPDHKKGRVHDVIEHQVAEQEHRSPHIAADVAPTQTSSPQGESSSVVLPESDESIDRRESQPIDMFDGLSKCLEDLRSENQKITRSQAADAVEERRRGSSCGGEVKVHPEAAESIQGHFWDIRQAVKVNENSSMTAPSRAYADEKTTPAPPKCDPNPVPSDFRHLTHQTGEPPANTHTAQHYWSLANSVPSVVPCGQAHADAPAAPPLPSVTSEADLRCPLYTPSTANVHSNVASPPPIPSLPTELPPTGRASPSGGRNFILIDSSSGEGESPGETLLLNYSDIDMSDSDPMEECYRIFMEAEKAAVEPMPQVPVNVCGAADALAMPVVEEKPQALPAQKRVAHVPRRPEPVAVLRPQPQVLVPLRGGPHLPNIPKVQQVQQRPAPLTASMKGGQNFVSSVHQRRPEAGAPAPPAQSHVHPPVSVQNAYMNCIPLGNAVIQVGNSLHFILPEGSYPLPSSMSTVLTPISTVNTSPMQSFQLSPVTPVHRYRPAPSVPVNPLTKRKVKQRVERVMDKVPHDVRQRYVNMFTEEFLKTSPTVKDAFEKALAEERTVYNRSVNKLKYLSVAVNALKRLKNQSAVPTKDENETASGKRAKGNIPLNISKLVGNGDAALYESLKEYIMNEEKLIEHNYPLQNPERPGSAILLADNKKGINDPLKRICCRCGATYSVSNTGKHTRKEECNYHYGKGVEKKVPGGVETRYSCCEGVMGAPGCQVFRRHVHDAVNMDGFVSSQPREDSKEGCPGVYSLDCEMCYTTHGLELSRVTVVNSGLQVVYDTFVKPDNEVVDFNTRFSGISEKDMKENCPSIGEVQQTLLRFVSADTILVGHGLETNLCALKFLHGTVVDTCVMFPHRLGPPHKLTLNNLTADYLRRIIQDSVCGHDTADDAAACMELVLWQVKEDGKGRKW
ncbi:unnamed protein product [Merluccius merluccius]